MPRALGGARLEASRLVRITYLDESGTDPREPFFVVAGVVVDGDKQLAPVEDYLEGLVQKHIPKKDWLGFVFHAADIWNGNNYFKDHDDWPWERREPIFKDVVETIPKFRLPVCIGFFDRVKGVHMLQTGTPQERDALVHTMSFIGMTIQLEGCFRQHWPDQYTILVHEDRPPVRQVLKDMTLIMRNLDKMDAELRRAFPTENLPLTHIRDTPHFASKDDCRLLQLSDHCAYLLRGTLGGNKRHQPYHDILAPQMISYPHRMEFHHDRAVKSAMESGDISSVFAPWDT